MALDTARMMTKNPSPHHTLGSTRTKSIIKVIKFEIFNFVIKEKISTFFLLFLLNIDFFFKIFAKTHFLLLFKNNCSLNIYLMYILHDFF